MAESVKASEDPKVAADIIGEEAYQRDKMTFGPDGTATDVSAADPLPVTDADALAALEVIAAALAGTIKVGDGSGALSVDGTVSVGNEPKVKVAELPELPTGSKSIGQVDPRGNVAHDEADSGKPVKVGARARTVLPEAVSQDDRSDAISDKFGRRLVTVVPLDQRVSGTLNRTNAESGQILAEVENVAYVVTAITVVNASATVGTKVEILDGETVKWKGYAGVLGGGFSTSDPNGLFVGTKKTKLNGKCVTAGADVDISVSAYKIPA